MKKLILLIICCLGAINPSFSQNPTILISPSQINLTPNQAASFQIDVNNSGSFNQQLFFSITYTNLPSANYSSSFFPHPLNYPYTGGTVLTIQTNGSIPIGNYIVVVTASNGPVATLDTCYVVISAPLCNWQSFQFPNNIEPGNGLTIDNAGIKWITGITSMVKFDGNTWVKYDNTNSNFPYAPYGIGKIAIDSQNNLWIPLYNKGLAKFDGTFWTVYNVSSSTIPSDSVIALDIDSLDHIWISTKNAGIAKFDGVNWISYNTSNSPLPENNILRLDIDRNGHIWIAGSPMNSSSGNVTFLGQYNGINWTFYNSANSCFTFSCLYSDFAFDQNNNLWFSAGIPANCISPSIGLVKFDGSSWEVWLNSTATPYNHYIKNSSCSVTLQDNSSELPVSFNREIYFDAQNTAWIASLGNLPGQGSGLIRFDGTTWQTITPSNSNIPGLAIRGIDFYNDSLWIVNSHDFYSSFPPYFVAKYDCSLSSSLSETEVNEFNVYPNPFHNKFRIEVKLKIQCNYQVQIYDLAGRKVYEQNENSGISGINDLEIDCDGIISGMYILKIISGESSWNTKIIAR